MSLPMKAAPGDVMESVIAKGDLGKLTEADRVRYYGEVCKSMGLNPLTQPFAYITLNNRLTLYATRACTDQLRKINGISLEVVSKEVEDGVLTVHVRAKDSEGRTDEDFGSVAFSEALKGEVRANAILKAVTKAKRRATLSICGLGWLDESEVADIPQRPAMAANPMLQERAALVEKQCAAIAAGPMRQVVAHDAETGEIKTVADLPHETRAALATLPTAAQEAPLNWIKYGQEMIAGVTAHGDSYMDGKEAEMERMQREAPKVYTRMMSAIAKLSAPKEETEDPEALLKYIREECAATRTLIELKKFEKEMEPRLAKAFPPDRQQAAGIFNARENEIQLEHA